MEANSVDVAIADPPYNIISKNSTKLPKDHGLTMGGQWKIFGEKWDKHGLNEYCEFTKNYLIELKRVLKPSGTVWIFGTYHNIGLVNSILRFLDIEIINEVIWFKRNAFPNLSNRRLTASHENIIWAHNGTKNNRSYFFDNVYAKNISESEDELKRAGKQLRTVWSIPNNKKPYELKYGKYPAQKPVRLLKRIICLSSQKEDTVLSLFSGSGSDCCACVETGRNSISIDNSLEAVELHSSKLENTYGVTPEIQTV